MEIKRLLGLILSLHLSCTQADTFFYDDAGRLTGVTQSNGLNHSYAPDEEGNVQTAGNGGADATVNGIADWWENYYFGITGINPQASPSGDGVSNLTKFALGLDPGTIASGSLVTVSFQAHTDGRTYPHLTFTRARDNAGLLTLGQSSNGGTTWQSGSTYFVQVGTAIDLGNGTERVTYRSLTPQPTSNFYTYRLETTGAPAIVSYYTINGGLPVPALPGWAFVLALILVLGFVLRFLPMKSTSRVLGFWFLVSGFWFIGGGRSAQAMLGPGWHSPEPENVPIAVPVGSESETNQIAAPEPFFLSNLSGGGGGGYLADLLVAGPSPTASSPELQALAAGLNNDPIKIFNYVKNKIEYQAYWGSHKGAHTTYLDGAGNDWDQCSLLIALLNIAGYTNTSYVYGNITMRNTAADGNDLQHWLGVPVTDVQITLSAGNIPVLEGLNYGSYITWKFDHLWVRAVINGTSYDLDPSYKPYQLITGINYTTASGYSRSQLVTDAGGTTGTDYVQNLNRANVENRLKTYATTLRTYLKTTLPNADLEQVLGGRRIIEQNVGSLSQGATPVSFSPSSSGTAPYVSFTSIPSAYQATFRVQIGSQIDSTFNLDGLQANRLSLTFSGSNAQLWRGDTLIAQETNGSGSDASVTLSVNHLTGTLNQNLGSVVYPRTGSYDLSYTVYPNAKSSGQISASNQRLETYLASGLADTSRQVLTETLHGLGLKWTRQITMISELVSKIKSCYTIRHHALGRTGQEEGYYVDMPGIVTSMTTGSSVNYPATNASTFLASAMEHGVLEQNGSSASVSTVKCLNLGNDAGQKIFRATSANFTSSVSAQLTNYTAADKSFFTSLVNAGDTLLLHQNGQTTLNQWKGYGVADIYTTSVGMIISGGYAGGKNSQTGIISGALAKIRNFFNGFTSFWPFGVSQNLSAEPVDLLSGAYTMDKADLTLGQSNSPRGLTYSRTYDSTRKFVASSLGNGWRHSCDGKITLSSELDSAFGFNQPTDAVQTIVGVLATSDFSTTSYTAKELMISMVAANWTVNQIVNNAANIQLGRDRTTYIRNADNTWNPPPGSTTTLSGSSGSFTLTPRFGGSVSFDAQNRISQWKDTDLNTQTYAYDANGRLSTVTDSFARTLTFAYSGAGTLIQNVTDSTGRSVVYTYTGNNLTGVRDTENYNTTFVYDSRNRLTDWRDHANAVITHNDYDVLDRVYQQLSQNNANKLWKFKYSPGQTLEINPLGNITTYLFDYKNRSKGRINALGQASSVTYDGQNHVTQTLDATGRQTNFLYNGDQNLTRSTDNNGKITQYQYDGSLRLWKITDATNRTTTLGYDGENHLKTITDPGNRVTEYFYRPDGLLDHVTDAGNKTTSITSYDSWGNPTGMTRADATTSSATYNARGDLLTVTDGRAKTTTFTYDKRRLLKTMLDARNKTATWNYDTNGNLANVTDRNNKVLTTVYNNLGLLQTMTPPDTATITTGYNFCDWPTTTTDGLSHTNTFGYDAAGRRDSLTDALNIIVSKVTFDNAGRISTQKNGLLHTSQYFYDTAGRLDYTLDPLNRRIDHTYDDAGRTLTLKNRRSKTFTTGYETDGLPKTFTTPEARVSRIIDREERGLPRTIQSPAGTANQSVLTYDGVGRIKTQTDPVGLLTWTYDGEGNATNLAEGSANIGRVFDELGRVTSVTDTQGNVVAYTYDNEGNILTITYPGNKTVTYTYDGANRLKTVTDWATPARVTTYFYDTAGRLDKVTRPNNVRQRVVFDNANRLQNSYEEKMSGNTVVSTLWQATYGFDNAYRLQTFTPTPLAKTYAPPTTAMTYDGDNQLLSYNGASVAHDLDGNLGSAPVNGTLLGALTWDKRNRLLTAGGVTYTYDAENRRITSTQNGQVTKYIWSRGAKLDRLLAKINPDNSVTRYVYGTGLLYEETTSSGGVAQAPIYYHFDWRGSTVALSDSAGNVIARLSYSPYGERTIESGTVNTPFCFNGQWGVMTESTGLYCMQARYYSPIYRRFLNEDPSGFNGGINLYAYCTGDPINLMDPFGLNAQGYLNGVGDTYRGMGSAIGETAVGLWSAVINPLDTIYGLGYSIYHLDATADAIGNSITDTFIDLGSGDNYRAGRAFMHVELTIGSFLAPFSRAARGAGASSRLAPGGGLLAHENAGGHLLARHVGQTDVQLAARLAGNSRLTAASTFATRAEAEAAVAGAFDHNATQVANWVGSGANGRLVLDAPFTGGSVMQAGTTAQGTGVRVILQGNGSGGFHILTGYPTP